MRMKPRLLVNLVTVVLLGVAMVTWVVTQIAGAGAFESPLRVTGDFASSGGAYTGQEVTYRGVLVGKIGELSLNDDGVNIELLIDSEWTGRIPSQVDAQIRSKSAVGEQYVDLVPVTATGAMLQDGDTIPRSRTHLPVDFQDLLRSLDGVLADVPPGRTRRVIQNLARGFGGHDDDIATILVSLGKLADAFADVAPQQKSLLTNSTRAGEAFLSTKDEFAAALAAAEDVFTGIADEPEELRALLASNDRLARAASALLAERSDDLAAGIKGLADLVDFQIENKGELIDKSLTYVPAFLHAVEDASIPWRSPDGREFYRIRIGLIYDNVRSTWPCKYKLKEGYERFPHKRTERAPDTDADCKGPSGSDGFTSQDLVDALERWAKEHP